MRATFMSCLTSPGQHKRSLSDVKEDAPVPKGAEHGECNEDKLFTIIIVI